MEAQPGATESQLYRWIAPTAEEQLAADTTAVPSGSGAVFVPAMTNGADEPETLVFQGEKRIASGPNGKRIVLAPGSYVLRIGSSPLNQMMSVPVEVTAGNTTLVPVTWGGIIVEVVDKNNVPHRGTYELIHVADRQPYTVGFGADTLLGEKLKTILATPGLYRIVRPGANYRTRTDFSTVVIPEGSMVYFKLVQDPDDGSLLGAGVVPPNEMGIVQPGSAWTRTMTVGFGLPITGSSNVVGTANQTTIGADFTFDTYLIYDRGKNYAGIIFEVEEGFVSIDPEVSPKLPLQKTVDRVRFDTIYTRLLSPRIGPYVRFGVLTNFFESNVLVTEDTTVVKHLLDGTTTTESVPANEDFNVGNAFAPVSIREGVGVNFRLLRGRIASLDWRGGLGFRQNRFNGAFVLDDSASGFQEVLGAGEFQRNRSRDHDRRHRQAVPAAAEHEPRSFWRLQRARGSDARLAQHLQLEADRRLVPGLPRRRVATATGDRGHPAEADAAIQILLGLLIAGQGPASVVGPATIQLTGFGCASRVSSGRSGADPDRPERRRIADALPNLARSPNFLRSPARRSSTTSRSFRGTADRQ